MTAEPTPWAGADGLTHREWRGVLDVAYRLLGSLTEAEDVAQETFVRWTSLEPTRRAEIRAPAAWCTTVATRLCFDLLGSARHRRERYVGAWLPEPLPGGTHWSTQVSTAESTDPASQITLDESVSMALLVVLDSLTPAERVAFVLHDVFAYPFADIATMVDRTPAACRQLASSARQRLQQRQATVSKPDEREAHVLSAFRAAWEQGEVDTLLRVLDESVVATVDGGGLVSAAPTHAITGATEVATFLLDVRRRQPDLDLVERTVNGRPGLVARTGRRGLMAVIAVRVIGERITDMWAVRNPEKLRPWAPAFPARCETGR